MTSKYLPVGQMAKYLGVSVDFLNNNRGKLFIEGKHYFYPPGFNKYMWDVAAMENWIRGYDNEIGEFGNIDEIVDNLLGD